MSTKVQDFIDKANKFFEEDNYQKAIEFYRKVLDISPQLPAKVFTNLGHSFMVLENYEESKLVFERLITAYPDLPSGYVGRAKVAGKSNNWQECVDYWLTCFKKMPNKVQPFWFFQIAAAYLKIEDKEQALAYYQTCMQKYPEKVVAYIGAVDIHHELGEFQRALDLLNTSFEKFPSSIEPAWYKKRIDLYLKMGQVSKAQREALMKYQSENGKQYAEILQRKMDYSGPHGLRFQHIFIITYGRSGSTLLQGILNTINGVIVRGENENIFYDFYASFQKLTKVKEEYKNTLLPNQPWFGSELLDEDFFIEQMSKLSRGMLLADQRTNEEDLCIGFKEVRYDEIGDKLEGYLDFLKKLFPDPVFIFNTRNLDDVVKSAWWKEEDKKEVMAMLKFTENEFESYAKKNENCFQINYKDIVANGDRLIELFSFIGATYDPNIIDIVLKISHSYNPENQEVKKMEESF